VIAGSQASLVVVSEHGVETIVTIPGGDWSETLRVRQAQTYVRAQLMDQDQHEMLALTNAVFVTDHAAADC
jgi:hypothetical protein